MAEYQKSIEFGVADDDVCPYSPYGSIVAFYVSEAREYQKAWELVHRAREVGAWIEPEVLDRLKKSSGRSD